MVKQKQIMVEDIEVPIIIDRGITYYPITYITDKILLRAELFTKKQEVEYSWYIKRFKIKFGESNTQLTRCISEDGLKERLINTESARLSKEKRIGQNKLHRHLQIELLSEEVQFIDKLTENLLNEHDITTKEVIIEAITLNPDVKFSLCSKCKKYYPLLNKFFTTDKRLEHGHLKICKVCIGNKHLFNFEDFELSSMVNEGGKELFESYKNDTLEVIFEKYIEGTLRKIPDCYKNKDDYLKMIKYLNDTGRINLNDFKVEDITSYFPSDYYKYIKKHDIYVYFFGENYYYYPWRYKTFRIRDYELTYELANKIFNNYLEEFKITIDDPFNFNYADVIHKARLSYFTSNGLQLFVIQYNNYKYAGYQYKISSINYYNNKDNVLFDLKHLIENDLKIDLDKIPLYLTKNTLQKRARPLYNFIVAKNNRNLYEWINDLYPGKFIEMDFDINHYRNEFDSIGEAQIHEILTKNLTNVIYNIRNDKVNISLEGGMQPDWIVIGKEKCWFIEYFGLWSSRGEYNKRTHDYMERAKKKIKKYEKMNGYGKVYLYPEDLENNFEGVLEKIKNIK